ncbi:MAG: AMP-binding protein, partial [Brevibacterium linens]
MKLGTMLDTTVLRHPDKEALVFEDQRFTYAELRHRALKATQVLADNGVGSGDVVAIMTFNVPGFVFAAFGAWYLGATVVPVNHKFQAPEVEYTIEHSGARLGIVSTELAEIARAGAPDITWLETEPNTPGSFDVQLDAAAEAEPGDFTDEQVAQILYTSGTTSSPKGCVHSHRNIFQ